MQERIRIILDIEWILDIERILELVSTIEYRFHGNVLMYILSLCTESFTFLSYLSFSSQHK